MTKPINLNRARKDRTRAARKVEADANSARFGRTKEEKAREASEASATRRRLDGHRRDGEGE
ncbi:protein of unknown function [Jannaschia faecimaris]|uniref:DUF4169 domain-containing protein n=1 Tax=Jannaschia faecimaris TaxID=1244108 RepID=A0A1H3S3B4_9RHOB|nr:DUF4169 family protein [Jannaschia faecimaris]SDZ32384.1 protein of unknown function [Jannaschia faecimaris]